MPTKKTLRDYTLESMRDPSRRFSLDELSPIQGDDVQAGVQAAQDNIDDQGGWGISPETRHALGDDLLDHSNPLSYVTGIPAAAADLGARAMQAAGAGAAGVAGALEHAVGKTGIDDYLGDYGIHPLAATKALLETPVGGELGFGLGMPHGAPLAMSGEEFSQRASKMLANGASREQMDNFAASTGRQAFGPELDKAIAGRAKGQGVAVLDDGSDVDHVLNSPGAPPQQVPDYYPPQPPVAHPDELAEPAPPAKGLASGNGMDDRELANYRQQRWQEKQAADAPIPDQPGLLEQPGDTIVEERPSTPAPDFNAEAAAQQQAKLNDIGKPEPALGPDQVSPDGLHETTYDPGDGQQPIPIKFSVDDNGVAEVSIDPFSSSSGRLGVAGVRDAMAKLQEANPEIKEFAGFRKSGANPGRVQEVDAPVASETEPVTASAGGNGQPPEEPPVNPAADEPAPERGPTSSDGGDEPPIDPTDVASRLTDALNRAGRQLPAQRAMYREARSERLRGVRSTQAMTSGESGFHQELSQLSGELPKQDFEGVREQFTQPEIDSLFDHIKTQPQLGTFGQINARTGLAKLLDGQLPTKSEIALLGRVFPADFVRAAIKNRSTAEKLFDAASNAINLPRSLMSSFDLSAPFRQGLFLVGRKEFWNSFHSMFKAFGSERAFRGIMDDIHSRPTADLMDEAGLSLAEPGHNLTDREEAFVSNWAEKIPLVGRGVRASDRAYTGFLNKVRADTFDSILRQTREAGIDINENPKALTDIAKFVNAATGRGSLGKFAQAGPLLNGLFFSPRLIASRVQLLNPAFYVTLSPVVRQEAIRSLLHVGALATTVTGLAAAGGLNVEADPRSSDFAKIRSGNTRFDILGGFGQYITLGARLATNQTKTLKGDIETLGKKYGRENRLDVATKFGISKFSPIAGFVADYLRGKTYTGDPFDVRDEAARLFVPLFAQDAAQLIQQDGAKGAAMAVPGVFGVGVNTYSDLPPTPVSLRVAGQDVELNRDARAKYQNMLQSYFDVSIDKLKKDGDWDKFTDKQQQAMKAQIIKDGKEQVKQDLFEFSQPTAEAAPAAPEPTSAPVSPRPVVSADQPLFDGFPGLPRSVGRTVEHNREVGGVANSDHLRGDAVDFVPPKGMSMKQLEAAALRYFKGCYVLNEGNHVHVRIPGLHGPVFGAR